MTFLIANANISDSDFKKKIILCEIKVLARFFKNKELKEMVELLKTLTKNAEVQRIIEKYGQGFDSIYFDGKTDGYSEGKNDGYDEGKNDGTNEAKIEVAKNFLNEGFDIELVARNTGLSIDKIKKLKGEL